MVNSHYYDCGNVITTSCAFEPFGKRLTQIMHGHVIGRDGHLKSTSIAFRMPAQVTCLVASQQLTVHTFLYRGAPHLHIMKQKKIIKNRKKKNPTCRHLIQIHVSVKPMRPVPANTKCLLTFVQRRPTSSTLVQHCTNVIQMFCAYWGVSATTLLVFTDIIAER